MNKNLLVKLQTILVIKLKLSTIWKNDCKVHKERSFACKESIIVTVMMIRCLVQCILKLCSRAPQDEQLSETLRQQPSSIK